MDKTNLVSLAGHDQRYRVDEAAYGQLARYLEDAGTRLRDDPDRAEIVADLERSIGDRLTTLLGGTDRLIVTADIDTVLEQVGAVGGAPDRSTANVGEPPRRRLQRIRDGQWIAGVCAGLAAYSELNVAWVRTLFVLGTLVTGGLLAVAYVAMAFILPVAATRKA